MISRRALSALAATPAAAAVTARAQPAPRRSADPGTAFPAPGRRPWADAIPLLRVGISGGENETDRLGRYEPYRRLLEETFGVPVRLYPAPDFAGVAQAFASGRIEVAQMGAANFAGAWLDTRGAIEALVAAEADDGTLGYVAVMLARADSGIADLAGMRGRSLAWADPNSTSGYYAPRAALRAAGIPLEPGAYFSRTGFGGGHEQAVVAVLHGQYDAACSWASGRVGADGVHARGVLRAMLGKGMIRPGVLRPVWQSDTIPAGPIACRTDLPEAFKEDLRRFLLALPVAHPDVYEGLERGGGAGFRTVTIEDYALVIRLREEEAAERRRRR